MPDLQSYYNSPDLTSAANEAATAGTTAVNYMSAAALLPQKLREAVMKKVDYNKDIINEQNEAQAEYFATPTKAREKYLTPGSENFIFDPFKAERLVAGERAQAYTPYATLTDILGQRLGTLADIIQAGLGAFNADVTAKQGAYDVARGRYSDIMDKAKALAAAASEEEGMKLAREKFDWDKSQAGKSGGTGIAGVTKADQLTAETWSELVEQTGGNEQGIWNLINRDQSAMRARGIDVNKLWQWHSEYANRLKAQNQPAASTSSGNWFTNLFSPKTPSNLQTSKSWDQMGLGNYDFSNVDLSSLNKR